MKKFLINILVIIVSTSFSLLLAEGISRIFYPPLEYLMPDIASHESLGHVIAPYSAGHDAWGFRNKSIPDQSDIVAIGDSQTYGDSATTSNSWPAQLEKITGTHVYNLGLGGYGPGHYLYLTEHNAIKLKPKKIIVGLYYGNDLIDSYNFAHNVKNDFASFKEKMTKHPIRFWLSGHSVVYRLITYSNLGDIIRLKESKSKNQNSNSQFAYDKPPLHTVFTPEKRLSALNLDDGKVYEGLQLSLSYLDKINLFCLQNNINLIVLLIPTKEHVYNDLLSNIDVPATFKQLITNETSVDTLVKDSLKLKHINYIDVLPALTEAAYHEQIYPVNDDGHPNLNGYNVIARTVAQQLR